MTAHRMRFQEAAALIKQNLDIVDIVGRYVALRKAGRNYTGLCPFHNEKTPSFSVSREKQLFKCFGCGEGGDALSFLMKQEHKTYGEIIAILADEQGIEIQYEGKDGPSKSELDQLLELQALAQSFFQAHLAQSETTQSYLASRQMTPEWQRHFGMGYAPAGWDNLVNHLKRTAPSVQQTPALMEKAGLASLRSEGTGFYDRFRNRLIIPIRDDRGRIIAFGGRSLSDEDQPKYLNSPETAIYVKNRVLYGLSEAKASIHQTGTAILMEGYFDVIAAHMAGITQAVGVCGTALTEHHLRLLQRHGAETLYLCFDMDKAGQAAALRSIELIENEILTKGLSLKVIRLPSGKDPDDFLKNHGADAFKGCMQDAQDFLQFKFSQALGTIEDIHSPEGRIKAVQLITPMLLKIDQPVIRHEHLKQLAERLNLAEETLYLELKRLEKESRPYGNKKNYVTDAIFQRQDRYTDRKQWNTKRPRKRPEDTTVFRKTLSEKLPVDQKEHLLLSYLFLNEESYRTVIRYCQDLQIQSPLAKRFLGVLETMANRWTTIPELVSQFQQYCHDENDTELMMFLTDRVMASEALLNSEGAPPPSLHQDLSKLVARIRVLEEQHALTRLNQTSKTHEADDDDQSALSIQLQLREALKSRVKGKSPEYPSFEESCNRIEQR